MAATVSVNTSELQALAGRMSDAAAAADDRLEPTFRRWAQSVWTVMREEVPVNTEETRNSITVEWGDGLSATVGPTNRDKKGRPVGRFINYGTRRQAPNDFVGRTAVRARQDLDLLDVADVL